MEKSVHHSTSAFPRPSQFLQSSGTVFVKASLNSLNIKRYKDVQSPRHVAFDRQRVLRSLRHWLCSNWSLQVWVFQVESVLTWDFWGHCHFYLDLHRAVRTHFHHDTYVYIVYSVLVLIWSLERSRAALPNVALWSGDFELSTPGMCSGQFACQLEKLHRSMVHDGQWVGKIICQLEDRRKRKCSTAM